jgi:hypothetical protein
MFAAAARMSGRGATNCEGRLTGRSAEGKLRQGEAPGGTVETTHELTRRAKSRFVYMGMEPVAATVAEPVRLEAVR